MSDGCCYLCNECTASFTSFNELEVHLSVVHHRSAPAAKEMDMCIKEEEMEDADMEEEEEEESRQCSPTQSPSSSERSGSLCDGLDESQLEGSTPSGQGVGHGFLCRHCNAIFEDQSQLNIHYTHTHRDKPHYECQTCPAVFAIKRELATHARTHQGSATHTCVECGKEFGTRQLLKKHCMWHSGERSHVCPHCNKAFFQKGHLTQHLMIHAGGRPHQCKLCQKTFIFKFDLNRHMKIHAERGFACTHCGKAFARNNQLQEHLVLKCKANRSNRTSPHVPLPLQSPSVVRRQSTPAGFPLAAPQPLLPFSNEQINKMAQSLLAQQHRSAVSMMHLPEPVPQVSCLFCAQRFPSQSALLLHVSAFHLNAMNSSHLTSSIPSTMPTSIPSTPLMPTHSLPSAFGLLTQFAANTSTAPSNQQNAKLGNATDLLAAPLSVVAHSNLLSSEGDGMGTPSLTHSNTSSSCPSSPPKSSPAGMTSPLSARAPTSILPTPPCASSTHVSPSTSSAGSLRGESPEPAENKCCLECVRQRSRTDELTSELEKQKDELRRTRIVLNQVCSLATQLGSAPSVDAQLLLQTKNVFAQIQNALRNVECQ